jgi:hypothetical protein
MDVLDRGYNGMKETIKENITTILGVIIIIITLLIILFVIIETSGEVIINYYENYTGTIAECIKQLNWRS